jgi:hypothetical protein
MTLGIFPNKIVFFNFIFFLETDNGWETEVREEEKRRLAEIETRTLFIFKVTYFLLLFLIMKRPEAGLLSTSSCLAPALGVTKFIWSNLYFVVLLKSDLDVQQTHLR